MRRGTAWDATERGVGLQGTGPRCERTAAVLCGGGRVGAVYVGTPMTHEGAPARSSAMSPLSRTPPSSLALISRQCGTCDVMLNEITPSSHDLTPCEDHTQWCDVTHHTQITAKIHDITGLRDL